MRHQIFYEIQTAIECPHRFLFFDRFIEPLQERDELKYSNIYFFTKVKKMRFDITQTKLTNKRTLKTTIIVGDSYRIDLEESLYHFVSLIRDIYSSIEEYNDLCSDDDDFWSCEIDTKETTTDRIHFLQKTKTGKVFAFWVSPESFERTENFENNPEYCNKPEVLYVGQSFRMLDRITSHKTLHRAVSELKDDEEIKIFFLTFKYGYGGHKDFMEMSGDVYNTWLCKHGKTNEFKSKIDLVERFLIHFLQPKYNTQHIKTKIENDRLVKEILVKNDIDTIAINIGVYGKNFEFWSEKQQMKTDFCSFNFLEPEKGYQAGLIVNEIKGSR